MAQSKILNPEGEYMAQVKELVVRFKQSTAADVVKNRVYIHAPNQPFSESNPFDEVAAPVPNADGFSRISFADLPKAAGLEGFYDVDVTAVDARGNESDPLEIDNQLFDLSPPPAPTDGSLE
jgi:hypothetical protein